MSFEFDNTCMHSVERNEDSHSQEERNSEEMDHLVLGQIEESATTAVSRSKGLVKALLSSLHKNKREQEDTPIDHCSGSDAEKKEFQHLYKKAVRGNAMAMFSLAFNYDTGAAGVKVNTEQAIHWYTEAAQKGHSVAMNNLGVLYYSGHNGSMADNAAEALYWYKKAGFAGEMAAQFHVGLMCMAGKGLERTDRTEAFSWFLKAAEQGSPQAMANVGVMLLQGNGVNTDRKKAEKWLRKAASHDNSVAMHNLGVLYCKGLLGSKVNETKGRRLIARATSSERSRPVPRDLSEETLQEGSVLMEL